MENLTYEAYLANPAIREQIDREVRQMRSDTLFACFAALRRVLSRGLRIPKLKILKLKAA